MKRCVLKKNATLTAEKSSALQSIAIVLLTLAVFLLTGCSVKGKIADAANDIIVWIARIIIMSVSISLAIHGIMFIIRSSDGENNLASALFVRFVAVAVMGFIALLLPQIISTISDIIGKNIIPSELR